MLHFPKMQLPCTSRENCALFCAELPRVSHHLINAILRITALETRISGCMRITHIHEMAAESQQPPAPHAFQQSCVQALTFCCSYYLEKITFTLFVLYNK